MNVIAIRQRSQWMAFIVSLGIVSVTLALTFFAPGAGISTAVGDNMPGPVLALLGEYQSPQRCRECHKDEYEDWSHTTHANALFDPIFRTYLEQASRPGECLACHTTGYNENDGTFVLAGVTCEACHGPYRSDHPEESMTIATSPQLCGDCHARTLVEWQTSRHGEADVICIDCHEVHTLETQAAASTNSLCATCHEAETADATHRMHAEAAIPCITCHLERLDVVPIAGHIDTGHAFTATRDNCTDCHG